MTRINTHLTAAQIKSLKAESKLTGVPVAEIIRRAIDGRPKVKGK